MYPVNPTVGRNPANQLRLVVYPIIYIPGVLFWISSINRMAATLIQNLALFILRQTFDHWPAVPLSVTVVVFHFVNDRVKAWGAWTNKFIGGTGI